MCKQQEFVGVSFDDEEIPKTDYDSTVILPKYQDGPFKITNPIAKRIVKNIMQNVDEIKSPVNGDVEKGS